MCESGWWQDNAAPGRTCGIWLEVLIERFGRRGEGSLFGIAYMEGNCIGDCQSQLLEDEFVGSGGCVGVTIEELGVGLFTPLIGGGKWDDAEGRRMKHCLVIHFLCHGAPPVELVVWAGPRPKEEAEEHWAHASIWADGHREEGSAGP